jgi:hypothetical protein
MPHFVDRVSSMQKHIMVNAMVFHVTVLQS